MGKGRASSLLSPLVPGGGSGGVSGLAGGLWCCVSAASGRRWSSLLPSSASRQICNCRVPGRCRSQPPLIDACLPESPDNLSCASIHR